MKSLIRICLIFIFFLMAGCFDESKVNSDTKEKDSFEQKVDFDSSISETIFNETTDFFDVKSVDLKDSEIKDKTKSETKDVAEENEVFPAFECKVDDDCNLLEKSECEEAKCVSGECKLVKVENCCVTDEDCDDGDVCTKDVCKKGEYGKGAGECENEKIENCCKSIDDCPDSESFQYVFCKKNACEYKNECTSDDEEVIRTYDFENSDQFSWQVKLKTGDVTWQIDDFKKSKGKKSLYFGNKKNHTYEVSGKSVKAKIESDEIFIKKTTLIPLLSFDLYLQTEWDLLPSDIDYDNPLGIDMLYLKVVDVETGKETLVWSSNLINGTTLNYETGKNEFKKIGVNLNDFIGKKIRLAFEFDSKTDENNNFEGAYIDNIVLKLICKRKCSSAPGCPDFDVCLKKFCLASYCFYEEFSNCCKNDSDCNDFNPFTEDLCKNSECVHTSAIPQTCYEQAYSIGFEDESFLQKCVVKTYGNGDVTWQITDFLSAEGSRSLYFGNSKNLNYENFDDQNKIVKAEGTITFPEIKLPQGNVFLGFLLYLDTEWSDKGANFEAPTKPYDELFLFVNDKEVWNSYAEEIKGSTCTSPGNCKFESVFVNLSDFSGQTVNFKFKFTSWDEKDNDHKGVFIDNFTIATVCVAFECFNSLECDDNDIFCTIDQCKNFQCSYEKTDLWGCCFPSPKKEEGFENSDQSDIVIIKQEDSNVFWQVVDTSEGRVYDGSKSIYFGDITTKTYKSNNNLPVTGEFYFEADIPEKGFFSFEFYVYLDVQDIYYDDPELDVFEVFATLNDNPDKKIEIFNNKSFSPFFAYYRMWHRVSFSLNDYKGKSMTFHFKFSSGDEKNNEGEGVYVDSIRIMEDCPP